MAQGVGTSLPMQGMQVRSLVWELRSHTQWGPGTTMKILEATTKTQIKEVKKFFLIKSLPALP